MDEAWDDCPEELVPLVEAARYLEIVVRQVNHVPNGFDKEATLRLCREARGVATHPSDTRQELFRALHRKLDTLHSTVPRSRDPETGDYEFGKLRSALNAVYVETNELVGAGGVSPSPSAMSREIRDLTIAISDLKDAIDEEAKRGDDADFTWAAEAITPQINIGLNLFKDASFFSNNKILAENKVVADNTAKIASGNTASATITPPDMNRLVGRVMDVVKSLMALVGHFGVKQMKSAWARLTGAGERMTRAMARALKSSTRFGRKVKNWRARVTTSLRALGAPQEEIEPEEVEPDEIERLVSRVRETLISGDSNASRKAVNALQAHCEQHPGRPLVSLDLSFTQVRHVGALSGLTNLQSLDLERTQVSDVGPLSGLTNLQSLKLMKTQVRHVGSLSGLTNLQSLDLRNTQVSDVGALSGLTNLQMLDLYRTQVSDVGALSGLTNLQSLKLMNTQVSDVGALSGLTNLQSLDLDGTQVSDVGALSGLTNLQSLDLRNTQVSDVGALSDSPKLERLFLPEGVVDNRHR